MDILQFLAVAVVCGLVYYLLKPRAPLRIRIRGGRVEVYGPAWQARSASITKFFQSDLPEVSAARIDGFWQDKRLRLRFHGSLSPGQQQRIRNFLLNQR